MQHRKRYTPEEKADALAIATVRGHAVASRQTGIPSGTIASWLSRSTPTPGSAGEQAVKEAWAQRRAALADLMGEAVAKATARLVELIEDDKVRPGDLVRAIAALTDRAQLLSGGATARVEVPERTPEHEAEVARVLELVREAA